MQPLIGTREHGRYLAYLVRLWQVNHGGEAAWYASIEDPHTGERRGFASLNALFAFLHDQTRESPVAGSLDSMSFPQ
jgi:hypothetical protein